MAGIFRRMVDALRGRNPEADRVREQKRNLHTEIRGMHAKVDAASSDEFSKRLWRDADSLGPNAAFNQGVRQKARDRARLEFVNNNYARGMVRTSAYDLIGTCPRLQLSIPGDKSGAMAKKIERSFARWGKAVGLGLKYRLMEKANGHSGGAIALLQTNPEINHKVKLDLRLIEIERNQTPWDKLTDPTIWDGIKVDEHGNHVEYYFLRYHPGEWRGLVAMTIAGVFDTVAARNVIHWYEQDRCDQWHGIPKISASLPLFSQLRRYTLATLTAAEFAAMLAGIMKTNLPPASGVAQEVDNWSFFELVRGALMSLPEGWEATQFDAKQPTTTYPQFKSELLAECGRGSGTPLNVVSGSSKDMNYSSGRLDHVPYHREKRIDRFDFESIVADRVLSAWEQEARFVDEVPLDAPAIEEWSWSWNYDGFEGIDQQKDANADDIRLKNGTSTLKEILAEYGQDVYEHMDQLAKERDYAISKGLPWPMLFSAPIPSGQPDQAPDEAPDQNADPKAQSRLLDALTENGISETVAEMVVAEFFAMPAPRPSTPKPSRNGFHRNGHYAGGRS